MQLHDSDPNIKTTDSVNQPVILLGAGIIGLTSALALADRGASVILIDVAEVGQGASWAGGGILSALSPWHCSDKVHQLIHASVEAYPALFERLEAMSGVKIEHLTPGMLFVSDQQDWTHEMAWCKSKGVAFDSLDAHGLREQGVQVGESGLFLPHIKSVRNPTLIKALKLSLATLNKVRVIQDASEVKLISEESRILGVKVDQVFIAAEQVLVCAGAWSGQLLHQVDVSLPTTPIKGQMIAYQRPHAVSKQIPIILYQGQYLIPRADGLVLAGSTLESVGFDQTSTHEGLEQLHEFAQDLMPELKREHLVNHWCGLRPYLAKGPMIGPVSAIHGLYVNTGHFRNGITMALASAESIATLML